MSRGRLLVSACLLGHRTRYDGQLRRVAQVCELSTQFELIAVCPEVDCGLPVPRPPMRLEGPEDALRLVMIESREDHTRRMDAWIEARVRALADEGIAGCILKSRSPSCGLTRVPRFTPQGMEVAQGAGLFARAVERRSDSLPSIEDDFLDRQLATFVTRLG